MTIRVAVALLVGSLAFSAGPSLAEEGGHSLEQLVVEMAHTSGQHSALAQHYRAKAEEARAERERHELMAATYGGGKASQRKRMKKHCQRSAGRFAGMAEEYDAVAALQDAEAKKP